MISKNKQLQANRALHEAILNVGEETDETLKILSQFAETIKNFIDEKLNQEYEKNAKLRKVMASTLMNAPEDLLNQINNPEVKKIVRHIQKSNQKFIEINRVLIKNMIKSGFLGQDIPPLLAAEIREEEEKILKAGIKSRLMAREAQKLVMLIGDDGLKKNVKNLKTQMKALDSSIKTYYDKIKELKSNLVDKPKTLSNVESPQTRRLKH